MPNQRKFASEGNAESFYRTLDDISRDSLDEVLDHIEQNPTSTEFRASLLGDLLLFNCRRAEWNIHFSVRLHWYNNTHNIAFYAIARLP